MKNTFVSKVDAERQVLKIINTYTKGSHQLAGLSWPAIDAWSRQTGVLGVEHVVARLRMLSDLCQRLSDRSHETFEPISDELAKSISEGAASLDEVLRKVFSK